MTVIRSQVSWGADLPEVRHRFCITPHFEVDTSFLPDITAWQTLADDLCAAMNTWGGTSRETNVKLYDAEASAPNYPKAEKTLQTAVVPPSTTCRELAVCLSYRAGDGPRKRGRLYLPVPLLGSSTIGLRPSIGQRQKAADLAPLLRALGGANVKWVVWSRVNRVAYEVQSAYVDDEWDVMRSRGLAPTTRLAAGTGS